MRENYTFYRIQQIEIKFLKGLKLDALTDEHPTALDRRKAAQGRKGVARLPGRGVQERPRQVGPRQVSSSKRYKVSHLLVHLSGLG